MLFASHVLRPGRFNVGCSQAINESIHACMHAKVGRTASAVLDDVAGNAAVSLSIDACKLLRE